jgi:AcrR family transcriptional regulator
MIEEAGHRRPGGRSARVRKAVLDATLELLVETGPNGLSIGEVAKRAGVHETSVYRRWGDRETLILDALLANSNEVVPVPDTGTVRGDLVALVRSVAQFLAQPEGAALARASALSPDDHSSQAEERERFWAARYALASAIIERGVRRGELAAGIDAQLVLETVVAPLHMRVLLTHAPIGDDLPERLVDLVLDGLSGRASTNQGSISS